MASNLPVTVDLTFYQGDSWTQKFRFLNDGTPVDLSGAGITAEARAAGALWYQLVVDNSNANVGEVVISPPTLDMKPGGYAYDVQVDQGGTITTWVSGRMLINQSVTP